MKKFLGIILAAVLLVSALSVVAFAADDVAYVAYNKGKDAHDGMSVLTPKRNVIGDAGALELVKDGGTLVVTEKIFFPENYTFAANGPVTITAKYGGKSYINPEPADNPASGAFKIGHNRTLTVASDLTIENIYMVSENNKDTILVKAGATLTIDETVMSVRRMAKYFHIVVEAGAKAVINGGIFSSVSGDGEIVIGDKAVVESDVAGGNTADGTPAPSQLGSAVVFINFSKGVNETNSGLTPESPKKSFGNKTNGALGLLQEGGTAVFTGNNTIESNYTWNVAGATIWTAKYNDINYVNEQSKTGLLRLNKGITVTVKSDLTLKDIILQHSGDAPNTILVTDGATLTVEDTVITKSDNGIFCNIVVEAGSTAVINGGTFATVSGAGTIKQGETIKVTKTVQLTIGSPYAYIDGVPQSLDAPAIIKNSRTMLPVRFLANTFGIDNDGIVWDDATKTATLKNDTTTIVITIGASAMTVNGESVALDSPAIIESSRTYLPVRAIANALGVTNDNITWDDATKTATLIG